MTFYKKKWKECHFSLAVLIRPEGKEVVVKKRLPYSGKCKNEMEQEEDSMRIQRVTEESFRTYGKVLKAYDCTELMEKMK